jgi:hypothetical protein
MSLSSLHQSDTTRASGQESKAPLRRLARNTHPGVNRPLDMFTAVEFLVQSDKDESQDGGHDDGYKRRGGADRHGDH